MRQVILDVNSDLIVSVFTYKGVDRAEVETELASLANDGENHLDKCSSNSTLKNHESTDSFWR
ncbi:MAG: hypothetical protein F6K42_37335 [Leptolyngbya sp. SIO1D8]|nr:hypothetical protein [Leptolyngbya sp. SIO1D8]